VVEEGGWRGSGEAHDHHNKLRIAGSIQTEEDARTTPPQITIHMTCGGVF
jgi:hypothetical protein